MDDPRVDASTSYQPHINGNHAGHYNDNINHYGNANGNGHGLTCDPSGHGVTVEDSQVGIQASQGHDFPATQEISSQPQGTPGSSANRADGRRTPPRECMRDLECPAHNSRHLWRKDRGMRLWGSFARRWMIAPRLI